MSGRHVRGPLVYDTYNIVTTGNYTVGNESVVSVNKPSGAATTITLPASVSPAISSMRQVLVFDGKGDAATNNITIAAAGSDTINGAATLVLSINYAYAIITDMGGGVWVSAIPTTSGAGSFTTMALTGLLTESAADSLTAAGTNQATALALTKQINRVTTGASTTGVTLPLAAAGTLCLIVNDVANGIHVYGGGTDTINDVATATGITQLGLSAVLYICTTTAPAGKWYAINSSPGTSSFGELAPYKLSTNTTTTTFLAAQMTGAAFTIYTSTAATPGSIATPTATAMFAAISNAFVGMSWVWRVINGVASNSMTITADASVTLSGKTTYVATPFAFMDFVITFTSTTTATMQFVGAGVGTTA